MAEPRDNDAPAVTTPDDVIRLYREHLGREPEDFGAIVGREGLPLWLVETEIYNSAEAAARRARVEEILVPTPPAPGAGGGGGGRITLPAIPLPPGVAGVHEAILNALAPQLRAIGEKLDGITGGKLTEIGKQLEGVNRAVDAAKGRITEDLTRALITLANGSLALADATRQQVVATVGGFLENAADVTDVAGAFTSELGKHKDALGDFVLEKVGGAFTGGLAGILELLEHEEPEAVNAALDAALANDSIPDAARGALEAVRRREAPLAALLGIPFLAAILMSTAAAVFGPAMTAARHAANYRLPVESLSPQEVAAAAVRDQLAYPAARDEAQLSGLTGERFATLVELSRQYPAAGDAIAAWLRGAIDLDRLGVILARLGYDAEVRKMLIDTAYIVAPAQDAIRFAVREVYDPERRAELSLDADFPERFELEARKAGISPELARDYWASHWELPAVGQVYEMLHRRARKPDGSLFTRDDLSSFLRTADFAPAWRGMLEQISYAPLTRVDVRRMRKLDILTREQVRDAYLDLGYDDANALRLADFVEQDVKGEKKLEKADLTAGLRSRIVTASVAGTITEARARAWLAQLGADPADVDVLIAEGAELRAGKRADRIRELVEQLVVRGKWSLDEGVGELRRRGFTDEELVGIREEVTLERELRAPSDDELEGRDLTKAEVLDSMSAGIIGEPEARTALAAMRYSTTEVDMLVNLEKYREAKSAQADAIAVVRGKRLAGKLTENEASQQLDALGVPSKQRNTLLAKWEVELAGKGSDLGVATVGELVKRKLMPTGEAGDYLVRLGYDQRERALLLALWGAQGAEAALRVQTAAQRAETASVARREAEERRKAAAAAAALARQRDLSRADLERAYTRKVITEAVLRAELLALRYSREEVETIVATIKAKGAAR